MLIGRLQQPAVLYPPCHPTHVLDMGQQPILYSIASSRFRTGMEFYQFNSNTTHMIVGAPTRLSCRSFATS